MCVPHSVLEDACREELERRELEEINGKRDAKIQYEDGKVNSNSRIKVFRDTSGNPGLFIEVVVFDSEPIREAPAVTVLDLILKACVGECPELELTSVALPPSRGR